MINDWVLYREEVLKVTSLYTKRGANEIGFGESENFWVDISNIEPIPLTPEIFEKNGFTQCEPQGYDLYVEDKKGAGLYHILWQGESYNYYLEISAYTEPFGEFFKNDIKYVHQLQHVLRLCGIEKEIEL